MKNVLLLAGCLVLSVLTYAQNDDNYTMYQAVTLEMKGTNNDAMSAAMKAHNRKFHTKDPYKAHVWGISSGPNVGKIVYMMGPLKFADLDKRPEDKAHDEDWKKVNEHVKAVETVEYWKRDDDLSIVKEGPAPKMIYVRIWKVSKDYGFLSYGLLKQISATLKELNTGKEWAVWDNQMRQGSHGRHMATVGELPNMAEMDKNYEFRATFEKVHGAQSWVPFIRSMQLAFEDSYDEIWTYMGDMSSE